MNIKSLFLYITMGALASLGLVQLAVLFYSMSSGSKLTLFAASLTWLSYGIFVSAVIWVYVNDKEGGC